MLERAVCSEMNGSESQIGAGFDLTVFAELEHMPAVLVAVSGGPDSVALLGLVATWANGRATPRVYAATVDHGLRPEAAAEAELVATTAAALGVPHAILPWQGEKPRTRLQERARHARYALLLAQARQIGATAVLTAHHADDQAETVLMRLGRGSGVRGLGGMRREYALAPDVVLIRPFLAVPKRVLEAECCRLGLPFVHDPSNTDMAFARARLRASAAAAARLGLSRDCLTRLAWRMQRAEEALEAEVSRVAALTGAAVHAGIWRADLSRQVDMSPEIILRLMERAVTSVVSRTVDRAGPSSSGHLRLERLEQLALRMHRAKAAGREVRTTLGGARVTLARDGMVEVAPEQRRLRGQAEKRKTSYPLDAYPVALS